MGYIASSPAAERILIAGHNGTGKSHAALSVAKGLPERKIHVVEVDWAPSTEVLLDSPAFDGVNNVEVFTAFPDDFHEQIAEMERAMTGLKRGDFLIIDSIDHSWDAARDAYITRTFGEEEPDEYFLKVREKGSGKGGDLGGWEDWAYIKKLHNKVYRLLARTPAHVIVTTGLKPLEESGANREDRDLFGRKNLRPNGRKGLVGNVRTAIFLDTDRDGKHVATALKDRGREAGAFPCENFFRDYLIARAGWKMEKSAAATPATPAPADDPAPAAS